MKVVALADYTYGKKKIDGAGLIRRIAQKKPLPSEENEELLQELCVPKKTSNGKINYLQDSKTA